jgi:hypothetical protein
MGIRRRGRGVLYHRVKLDIYIHEGIINLRDVWHHEIINEKVVVVVGINANKGIGGKYSG